MSSGLLFQGLSSGMTSLDTRLHPLVISLVPPTLGGGLSPEFHSQSFLLPLECRHEYSNQYVSRGLCVGEVGRRAGDRDAGESYSGGVSCACS